MGSTNLSEYIPVLVKIRWNQQTFNMETYIHFCMASTGRFVMYYGITKIYYRKTVGHVFMKPVQIEGTNRKFFSQWVLNPSSHFCHQAMWVFVVRKWPLSGRSHFMFHSFIHLFHIPLILYRCGISHVYIYHNK